jgi:hypothetical protein
MRGSQPPKHSFCGWASLKNSPSGKEREKKSLDACLFQTIFWVFFLNDINPHADAVFFNTLDPANP